MEEIRLKVRMLDRVSNDLPAVVFGWLRGKALMLYERFSTFKTRLYCFLLNVKLGNGIKFFGRPDIRRGEGAFISIGSYCTFRSGGYTNRIGVSRRCLIGAYAEDAAVLIGEKCGFNGTVIASIDQVTIGDKTLCGANTLITDFDWHLVDPMLRHSNETPNHAPVTIEENVWLGYGVVVLKGVRIGRNSVVTANSVVVNNIPENVIAGGNPARVISKIKNSNDRIID